MSELPTVQLGMGCFPDDAGGVSRYFDALLRRLPACGVSSHALVTGEPGMSELPGLRLQRFAPASSSLSVRWRALRRAAVPLLRGGAPPLVACHFPLYGAALVDQLRRLPLVVHFHGPWADEGRVEGSSAVVTWLRAALERLVYRRGVRFVVLSQAFAALLAARYRVAEERIRVVPGGVDAERFASDEPRRDARVRLGLPTDRPILVAVRRLAARMGLDRLIAAVDRLRRARPDVLLVIAGRGPQQAALARLVDERRLGNHVRLLGYVGDDALPRLYRAADLCVVPSVALEGFGLAVVEALAAGRPVVATPVGGLPEILAPLAPALLTRDLSEAALSDTLRDCLDGKGGMPSAERCRAHARSRYAWDDVAARVAAVYRECRAEAG